MPAEEDHRRQIVEKEKLRPDSEAFQTRMAELRSPANNTSATAFTRDARLGVMAFYPMSKRRQGPDNWFLLDFATRKKLMGGHARIGRKYAGRVSQLITGSTGLDDWEWGVTLMAHQADALKEIVYEMRFDEVERALRGFGPFFVNMQLNPAQLWAHLRL